MMNAVYQVEKDNKPVWSIDVTFPKDLPRQTVKELIEGNLKKNSEYTCKVYNRGTYEGQNLFEIIVKDVKALYFIGVTAAVILQAYEREKSKLKN